MEQADSNLMSVLNNQGAVKRKYLAEAGLHLFTGGPAMFRPSDLYQFGNHPHFRETLKGTNIYLICRRRRISINPQSIEVRGGRLYGEFIVHGDSYFEWERERFSQGKLCSGADGEMLDVVAARAADPFGHALEVIDEQNRRCFISSAVLVALGDHCLGSRTKLEVLYVGQTFGKVGERLSLDRLKRHTTLQRIMADCAEESGNDEILLLAFQYGSTKNWLSTAGDHWVEPSATQEEESTHMAAVGQQVFDRKTRVLLAEAALINYFKPRYNILHRDSFVPRRSRKLKTLKKLFEADMSALIVEVNTSNICAKLWSPSAPTCTMEPYLTLEVMENMRINALDGDSKLSAAQVEDWLNEQTHAHIARFALYEKSERETFLHALQWGSQ